MKLLINCVLGKDFNTIITFGEIRRIIVEVDRNSFYSKPIEDRLKGLDLKCQAEMKKFDKKVKVLSYQEVED